MPTPAKSHGCTWHWLTQHDLPEIMGLVAAEEHLGEHTHHHDLRGLSSAAAGEHVRDTETGVVLRKPSGTLIAYAWIRLPESGGRCELYGGCHPAWRDEGIQETLLSWQFERAREWHAVNRIAEPMELAVLLSHSNHFLDNMLRARGFRPQRRYHALRRPLGERLDAAEPDGVTLVSYGPAWSEPIRVLYNEGVARPDDRVDPEAWAWNLTAAGIQHDLSWVALHDGHPVGWVLNAITDAGERAGWTEYLGATSEWRNRGLYRVLLARSFDSFAALGLGLAGIAVETDSDQGARPYLELGYQPVDAMAWYVYRPVTDTLGPAKTDEQQMGR